MNLVHLFVCITIADAAAAESQAIADAEAAAAKEAARAARAARAAAAAKKAARGQPKFKVLKKAVLRQGFAMNSVRIPCPL